MRTHCTSLHNNQYFPPNRQCYLHPPSPSQNNWSQKTAPASASTKPPPHPCPACRPLPQKNVPNTAKYPNNTRQNKSKSYQILA